jgi:Leucine-rich repeat (LRR) protein
LPDELSALTSLEDLWLEGLPLKELPGPVRALKKLRVLSVEDTPMATLPEWIGELPLEKLWVSKKHLGRGELTRLSRLTRATIEVR